MKGLTRENDDVIGFVVDALYERAIDIKELNDWAINIVINNNVDELTMYIIDLMDFDNYLKDIYEVIGFVPDWKHSKKQSIALYAIAIKRGRGYRLTNDDITDDDHISDEEALNALQQHPEIEKRFRETFPFIDF